jgi:transcriptional regulator with XRE-family HTH domain
MAVDRVASHAEFARRVGITFGMASRLCSGDRAASRVTLNKIIDGFGLEGAKRTAAVNAWMFGPQVFGSWLRSNLYRREVAA